MTQAASLGPGQRRIGTGQRIFWLGCDLCLLVLVVLAIADLPNRWHVASLFWLAAYGLFVLRVTTIWPSFYRLVAQNWSMLLYPAVCLASVAWSGSRGVSLVGGIQVMMTVLIALFLGWRFTPRQLIVTVCGLISAAAVLSLGNWLTGTLQPVYSDQGGLLGIYTNKNMLGHYSQMAALMALTIALTPPGQVHPLLRRMAPLAFLTCGFAVLLSQSMTAVLLLPCYTGLLLLLNRRRLPSWLRFGGVGVVVLLLGLGPLALAMMGIDPMAEIFRATGKDATLTGRTQLWSIAARLVAEVPLTGYGYGAFWQMERFSSQHFAVLQAGATSASFHNFMADVAIGTGFSGLLAMFALLLTALSRALRYYRFAGTALATGCLITTFLPITIGMVEPFLYRQHEFMLTWLVMLAVSIQQHTPPFRKAVRPRPPRGQDNDWNKSHR